MILSSTTWILYTRVCDVCMYQLISYNLFVVLVTGHIWVLSTAAPDHEAVWDF